MSPARKVSPAPGRSLPRTGENPTTKTIRYRMAALSVAMGLLALPYPLKSQLEGMVIPGWILCVLGGLAGGSVWIVPSVWLSRRIGLLALVLTGLGTALFVIGR